MTQKEFGERIHNLRTQMGLSQLEFGLRCNMDSGQISKLEKGIRAPLLDTIFTIAKGLDISIADLLEESEPVVSVYDESINKVISYMLAMRPDDRPILVDISKALQKRNGNE